MASLILFLLMFFVEKRGVNWFYVAIGFEIAFLTFAFLGVSNAILEGVFYESYQGVWNNFFTVLALFGLSWGISIIAVKKMKTKKVDKSHALNS